MEVAMVLTVALVWGVDYGWQPQEDGSLEYIIQLEPWSLDALRNGDSIVSEIHPEVHGVRRFRIQVGRQRLPRDTGSSVLPPVAAGDSDPPGVNEPIGRRFVDEVAARPPTLVNPVPHKLEADRSAEPLMTTAHDEPVEASSAVLFPSNSLETSDPNAPSPEPSRFERDVVGSELSRYDDVLEEGDEFVPESPQSDQTTVRNSSDETAEEQTLSITPPVEDLAEEEPRYEVPRNEPMHLEPTDPLMGTESPAPQQDTPWNIPRLPYQSPRDSERQPQSPAPDVEREPLFRQSNDNSEMSEQLAPAGHEEEVEQVRPPADLPATTKSERRSWPFAATLVGLFASLASNAYMGWITWSAVNRYRELAEDVQMAH